jgi:hypothetical protein
VSGIGGYVRRKDRRQGSLTFPHRNPDALLGKLRYVELPSGEVVGWRFEPPLPQAAPSPLTARIFR